MQSADDGEPTRLAWNPSPSADAERPDWNQAPADSIESADTVAYTPPVSSPGPPSPETSPETSPAPVPVYTPPAPVPVYTPPAEQPTAYAPPVEPPPVAPTPPVDPPELSPAADQLPETVAYAPAGAPPQQQPAFPPPVEQPPTFSPPPAVSPPPVEHPPAYTPPVYNQPPAPAYGTPAAQPGYQAGYAPAQPWAGQMQPQAQPKKKSRAGCLAGCLVALVLVVGLVGGGFVYLRNQPNGVVFGGVTIGGASTGPNGGALIYQDALDGSTKSDWTSDSNCSFGSGGYHIRAGFICYAPPGEVGDATTTVSVKQISGPITYPYGLVIRRTSKGNYYEFGIDANGKWRFAKVVNGTDTEIVKFTENAAIKKGLNQVNTLSVQANGSHFVFSVNGTQVGSADDSTFASGRVGLVGYNDIEVIFNNLSVEHVKS